MNKFLIFYFFVSIIMFPEDAFAYLDPGTGSIILQAIIGFLAASIPLCIPSATHTPNTEPVPVTVP